MASSTLGTKNATFIVGKFSSPRHLLEAKRGTSRRNIKEQIKLKIFQFPYFFREKQR
jgi:hypothetical protein